MLVDGLKQAIALGIELAGVVNDPRPSAGTDALQLMGCRDQEGLQHKKVSAIIGERSDRLAGEILGVGVHLKFSVSRFASLTGRRPAATVNPSGGAMPRLAA